MLWSIKSVRTCPGTKVRHTVVYVMLRQRQQNRAFSADVVEERADGSLALEFGNLNSGTEIGVASGDCVGELDVHVLLTWATGRL